MKIHFKFDDFIHCIRLSSRPADTTWERMRGMPLLTVLIVDRSSARRQKEFNLAFSLAFSASSGSFSAAVSCRPDDFSSAPRLIASSVMRDLSRRSHIHNGRSDSAIHHPENSRPSPSLQHHGINERAMNSQQFGKDQTIARRSHDADAGVFARKIRTNFASFEPMASWLGN